MVRPFSVAPPPRVAVKVSSSWGVDDGGDRQAVLDHGDGHAPPRLAFFI
jgi:hypothetical protein